MGKPIIAPNTAPVRDVIDDGRTGLLIGNGEGALVDLLEHVLRDPTEVRRMGERFQKQVLTEHTWSQNARRALEFIQGKG